MVLDLIIVLPTVMYILSGMLQCFIPLVIGIQETFKLGTTTKTDVKLFTTQKRQ